MTQVPFCSDKHQLIPSLASLHDKLSGIDAACVAVNGLNYGSRITLIQSLAADAAIELNRLCLKDIDEVTKKECV